MNTDAMTQCIEFLCYTFELERSSDEERFQEGKEFFEQKAREVTDLDDEDNYNYWGSLMEAAYQQEEFVGMLCGVKERVRHSGFWVTSPTGRDDPPRPDRACPSRTVPASGTVTPASTQARVVLPAPPAPRTTSTSASLTWREISRRARRRSPSGSG